MHKGVLFICLWAMAGSSYIPNAGEFVHPHIHGPPNGELPLGASGDAVPSPLKKWQEGHTASLGVSYARFEYRGMNLSYQNSSKSDVMVTLNIANVGDAQGNEVLECYVSWANKSLPVPREQLVYFDSIHLDVNQAVEYAFVLTWMSWAFWSNGTWIVQAGQVTLCCGDQQPQPVPTPDVLCSQFPVYA